MYVGTSTYWTSDKHTNAYGECSIVVGVKTMTETRISGVCHCIEKDSTPTTQPRSPQDEYIVIVEDVHGLCVGFVYVFDCCWFVGC